MIKPIDNREAINILTTRFFFPPINFLRCSSLARKCNALIQADRHLAKADRGMR